MTDEDNGTEDEALMLKTYCGRSQLKELRRLACIGVCNISGTTCCVSLLVILEFISCCVSVLVKIGTSVQIFVVFDLVVFNACDNRNGALRARRLKILDDLSSELASAASITFRVTKRCFFQMASRAVRQARVD